MLKKHTALQVLVNYVSIFVSGFGSIIGTVATVSVVFLSAAQAVTNPGVSVHGRILKPDGTALEGLNVDFKIQITTPDAAACVLYEETKALDLSSSAGAFAFTVNDGTGNRTDTTGHSLERIFANRGTITVAAANCSSGTGSYIPGATDYRNVVISFKDETMTSWEALPAQRINFVPYAIESRQIGGFTAQNLLRVEDPSTGPQTTTPLTPTNFTELLSLLQGTSSMYALKSTNGVIMPTRASATTGTATGQMWFDSVAGMMKYWDGSAVVSLQNAGGTGVTSITAGAGLTGGTITSTGTIAMPVLLGSAGTSSKVTYDIYGRITAVAALAESDIPTLSTAGKVSGSAITSGTIAGSTIVNTSGDITGGNVSAGSLSGRTVRVFNSTNANYVTIQTAAPAVLTANKTLTLPSFNMAFPAADGVNGQVLQTDGAGNLQWYSVAGLGGAAGGDLTGTYPNPTLAKIMGRDIDTGAPADGQAYIWDVASNKWKLMGFPGAPVQSVAGRTGNVVLTPADLTSMTLGSTIYGSAGNVGTQLAGNTTTTKKLLTQTGDGTNSAAPAWGVLDASDLPAHSTALLTSGTLGVARGGTGAATLTTNQILVGNGTSAISALAAGTSGQSMISAGAGVNPAFRDLAITDIKSANTAGQGFLTGVACTAGQALTYSSITDQMTCSTIAIADSNITYASQAANKFFASPNGSAGAPTYRTIVAADLPSITSGITGILPIANGGTGQSSAGAAFNALSPMTTLGDTIYGGASGAGTRLAGNTTTTKMVLTQTGDGTNSAAPTWTALVAGDIPNIDASKITTGTLGVARGGTGASTLTTNQLLVGNGTSAVSAVAAGTSGQLLQSSGAGVDPAWTTATYPAAVSANNLLYASGANTVGQVTTANTSVLVTSSSGVPSYASGSTANRLLKTDGTTVSFAQASLTTDVTGTLPIGNGGTGTTTGSITGSGALTLAAGGANQNVTLTPSGTGYTVLNGNVGIGTTTPGSKLEMTGVFRLDGATSGYSGLQAPAVAGSNVWTLPAADGTAGQILKTDGVGNLGWVAQSSGVTSVATGTGLTGGTITSTGTISLASIANNSMLANVSGGAAAPTPTTLTALIDSAISGTQGATLYRNGANWTALSPGTAGQMLQTGGAAANPAWSTATYPSTVTANNLLYASGNDVVGQITTANTSALVTSSAGVPSWVLGTTANRLLRTDGTTVSFAQANLTSDVTGTLPIGNGGTGQTSAGAAFNALSPMTTLGDTIYGGASGAGTRLAGNTTTTKKVLTQTGDGTNSAAPSWTALVASDIPDIDASKITSGTLGVARGGTGASTLTTNQLLVGNGTSAVSAIAAGTSGQILTSSGAAVNPAWTTATYPATVTANNLIYASGTNAVGQITTANSSVLVTSSAGAPSWASGSTANRLLKTDGTTLSFSQASLTTDVTGTLPIGNGGTGTTTGSITGSGALTFAAGGANQNVTLTPSGTGFTLLNGNVGIGMTTPGSKLEMTGALRFDGATSGYAGFQAPATAGNNIWTLPTGDGTNGQVLKTDGVGNLGWVAQSSGVTSVATGTGLTGGTITTTGTISLASIANNSMLANVSGGAAAPTATTLTALIDSAISGTQGATLYRNGSNWTALSPGTSGQYLQTQGAGANPQWANAVSSVALSAPGIFSVSGSPVTTTGTLTFSLASQSANQVFAGPTSGSAAPAFRSLYISDVRSLITVGSGFLGSGGCTSGQALTYSAITDQMSCTTIAVADSNITYASQTANKVFASPNGSSGAPTYRALVAADLPSVSSGITGILPIANGGTGQSSAGAAFNALSPMTTLGDTIYGGASGAGTRLAGNTTATKKFLNQTGDGTNSAAPAWAALVAADIPSLDAGVLTSGTLGVARGGTGATTLTTNQLLVGNGTSAVSAIAAGSSGQILTSSGAGVNPAWTTATYPATVTANNLLYASGTNAVGQISTANTSVLVTSSAGAPSWASGSTANRLLKTDGTTVSFAQASLTTDVTGTLPIGNGGTGSTTGSITGSGALTFAAGGVNQNVTLTPSGTGYTILNGNVGIGTTTPGSKLEMTGALRFDGATSGYAGFQAPAVAGNNIWTLPTGDGSSGQVLTTNGSGVLSWAAAGSGVTSVATGSGLTGGPITSTGTISLASVANNTMLANVSGGAAAPSATTLTALIDSAISGTHGAVLYRNGSNWTALSPGTSGQFLQTAGAAANPAWANAVSSVALSAPSIFSVSGSPVTSSGTLTFSLASQTAYTVLAGPTSGSAAPTFRNLNIADIRSANTAGQGFLTGSACTAGQALTYSSVADQMSCTAIAVLDSNITYADQTTNKVLAAPNGSTGTPSFRALASADLPSISSGMTGTLPVANGGTGTTTGSITGTGSLTFAAAAGNNNVILTPTGTGAVGIGMTPATSGVILEVNGTMKSTDLILTSDARAKRDIASLDNSESLRKICSLRPVAFNWKTNGSPDQGVIAQELREIFPEFVRESSNGALSVKYTSLIAPLISSVQELNSRNRQLQGENEQLKARIEGLEEQNKQMQNQLGEIYEMLKKKK